MALKSYTLSFARAVTHCPEHPERTAVKTSRDIGGDYTYKVWPSPGAMQTSVGMRRETNMAKRLVERGVCPALLGRHRRR